MKNKQYFTETVYRYDSNGNVISILTISKRK